MAIGKCDDDADDRPVDGGDPLRRPGGLPDAGRRRRARRAGRRTCAATRCASTSSLGRRRRDGHRVGLRPDRRLRSDQRRLHDLASRGAAMTALPHRPLGSSGLDVSLFSLGSWRTFERIPREQGLAVMRAARDAGITFLDDARYNDETGNAPIPTGYSRGRLRRAVPRRRLDARRGRRGQQAVVGVLARAGRRGRARRLARADGSRPHRPDLHDAAAGRADDRRPRRRGRRVGRVRAGARLGRRQLAGGRS